MHTHTHIFHVGACKQHITGEMVALFPLTVYMQLNGRKNGNTAMLWKLESKKNGKWNRTKRILYVSTRTCLNECNEVVECRKLLWKKSLNEANWTFRPNTISIHSFNGNSSCTCIHSTAYYISVKILTKWMHPFMMKWTNH